LPLVPVQSHQEIEETLFLDLKKFLKNLLAAFGTWYYLQKNLKTKVVPGIFSPRLKQPNVLENLTDIAFFYSNHNQ
jgi:hypothetical protein